MRARQWVPELGTFLQVDKFAFHDAKGTLWGWPNQNPTLYSDPSGRGVFGAVVGFGIGGYVGSVFGAPIGAAAFGVAFFETGPGEVVAVPVGAIVGTVGGGLVLGTLGAGAGSAAEDAIRAAIANAGAHPKPLQSTGSDDDTPAPDSSVGRRLDGRPIEESLTEAQRKCVNIAREKHRERMYNGMDVCTSAAQLQSDIKKCLGGS
jgi:hypothetical protein